MAIFKPRTKTLRALSGFLLLASGLVALRAQAYYERSSADLVALHRALFEGLEADHTGKEHVLTINGARFVTQSGGGSRSAEEVLGDVTSRCRTDSRRSPFLIPNRYVKRSPDEIVVICYKPRQELNQEGVVATYLRFLETGSLSELGEFIGAYIRPDESGASFLLWKPENSLNLAEMFPLEGDAPGPDLKGVPRPRGRRLLNAALDERTLLSVYAHEKEQLTEMSERLAQQGFQIHRQTPKDGPSSKSKSAFLAQDATRSFLLVDQQGSGSSSALSLLDTSRDGLDSSATSHLLLVAELP